jgi:hypothetical protein
VLVGWGNGDRLAEPIACGKPSPYETTGGNGLCAEHRAHARVKSFSLVLSPSCFATLPVDPTVRPWGTEKPFSRK